MLPRITVAVPTRNRPQFLIRSVRSILAQSFKDFELIILDNGSRDLEWQKSAEFADPRIRLICHPNNIGIVENWNTAIREAKSEAICIFHDDDRMWPLFLESLVKVLDGAPSVGLAFPLGRRVDCLGNNIGIYCHPSRTGIVRGEEYILWNLRYFGRVTLPAGVVVTRKAYDAVGQYSQNISESCFDTNLYLRVAMQFDVGIVDQVLVDYTLHPSQISENIWRTGDKLEGMIDVCMEMLFASCWLLEKDSVKTCDRLEIASIIRDITRKVRIYSRNRSPSHRVF